MIFTPKINTANMVDLTLYGVSVCIAANIGPTQNVTFTDIKNTRRLLDAALSGELSNVEMRKDDNFGFFVPLEVNGINGSVLDPRSTWADSSEYDLQAKKLVNMFIDNFVKFESDVEEKIINSGPSQI